MDVREKLVKLLREVQYLGGLEEKIADHLIANGVTVGDKVSATEPLTNCQKWISLSEQKPNRDDRVIVFFEGMKDTPAAIQILCGWCVCGSASHWMPLPEPPKGE